MAGKQTGKISDDLAEQMETAAPGEPIQVIVELEPPPATQTAGSRAERIAERRRSFDATLASVAENVGAPGKILDSAWINSTLRAELTRDQIEDLQSEQRVLRIDSPRAIHAEA